MNKRMSKLLRRFCMVTERNYDSMKAWYDRLNSKEKEQAGQEMKEELQKLKLQE